jgi:hypothetical protein
MSRRFGAGRRITNEYSWIFVAGSRRRLTSSISSWVHLGTRALYSERYFTPSSSSSSRSRVSRSFVLGGSFDLPFFYQREVLEAVYFESRMLGWKDRLQVLSCDIGASVPSDVT